MILILFLVLFNLVFLQKVLAVESFSSQFVFTNNQINFDSSFLIKVESASTTLEPLNILSFNYQLTKNVDLPTDIPLFIVSIGEKVIFYADASLADGLLHKIQIPLLEFVQNDSNNWPVFYRNNVLDGFELKISEVNFVKDLTKQIHDDLKIREFSAVKELDQSLTVVFKIEESVKNSNRYDIFCLDEKQKVVNSATLSKKDDFMWSNFYFTNFFSNQNQELIFNLNNFLCDGLVYVVANNKFASEKISIIDVRNL